MLKIANLKGQNSTGLGMVVPFVPCLNNALYSKQRGIALRSNVLTWNRLICYKTLTPVAKRSGKAKGRYWFEDVMNTRSAVCDHIGAS